MLQNFVDLETPKNVSCKTSFFTSYKFFLISGGKFSSLPGGKGINKTVQRGDPKILAVAKTEMVAQEKKQVIKKIGRRDGIHSREREITGLKLAMGHGLISFLRPNEPFAAQLSINYEINKFVV